MGQRSRNLVSARAFFAQRIGVMTAASTLELSMPSDIPKVGFLGGIADCGFTTEDSRAEE